MITNTTCLSYDISQLLNTNLLATSVPPSKHNTFDSSKQCNRRIFIHFTNIGAAILRSRSRRFLKLNFLFRFTEGQEVRVDTQLPPPTCEPKNFAGCVDNMMDSFFVHRNKTFWDPRLLVFDRNKCFCHRRHKITTFSDFRHSLPNKRVTKRIVSLGGGGYSLLIIETKSPSSTDPVRTRDTIGF